MSVRTDATKPAFHASVLREAARSRVLGAYADERAVHYLFLGAAGIVSLSERRVDGCAVDAVSATLPSLAWDEREMQQERHVLFDGLPDARGLFHQAGRMPDAVVARGRGLMQFVVGPVHAGIIEPGRFTFSSGGETVVHLDAQLGYGHRGAERALEGLNAREAAVKVARICGGCSAARSFAYARALEGPAGVTLPESVELARVALAELERIYNHLGDVAASASGAGYAAGFSRGMALKERAMRLCYAASGHRLLFDAVVPGGVGTGVRARGFAIEAELRQLGRDTERYLKHLFAQRGLRSRWRGSGFVSKATAETFGATGPASRASHGELDLRSKLRYGAYAQLNVSPARRTAGDVLARCEVKREEIVTSFALLRTIAPVIARARLPEPASFMPSGHGVAAVEGPRGAEVVAVHVDDRGSIERLHLVSASYRNWPLVARAMEDNIVPDFPLVNKSFNLCYACADR